LSREKCRRGIQRTVTESRYVTGPDLPLHAADGNHQSALVAFLTACVLTGRLTGDDSTKLAAFPYEEADEKDRRFLARLAAAAITEKRSAATRP
jgi:hypothetical protein